MPRTTKTITFSLPLEMADWVEEMVKQEGCSRSELLREALYRYKEENEWQQLLSYGEQRTREQKISPEDVSRLVEEYRAEISSSRA
ncbi:MAG: ribbon-helix-helix protein, CopG family [Caldilineaceae bacterium]|nr:ribbon-helix-helix protein, CopG family [Caldilineaceae bacterium]